MQGIYLCAFVKKKNGTELKIDMQTRRIQFN